jgi:hypothetical protein
MAQLIGSAFDKLVRDFSEIKIELRPTDEYISYYDIDQHDNYISGKEYLYNILFQGDFLIRFNSEYPLKEYYDYLLKLKNEYYREINDHIENYIDKELVLNDLSNHRLQFEEIRRLYKNDLIKNEPLSNDIILHDNVFVQEVKDKPADHVYFTIIANRILKIQLIEIQNIITFIQEKFEITKGFLESKRQVDKKNKSKTPLDKLDRYQTALLFYYLNESGIIQYKSSNEIAPIVQSLTGHSAQNLQTEAFNKIFDVKTGKAGNKLKINSDKSYNLKIVKDAILEVLRMVHNDLEKNKALK